MNTEADIEQYFSNRFNQAVSRTQPPEVNIPEVDGFAKQRSLEKASAEKIAALEAITQRRAASREANKNSWVAQSGVASDGVAASAINLAAQVADGASTIVGGTIASLPDAIAAASAESGMSAADTEAFNRYQRGTATPEDIQLLSQPKLHATQTDTPEARLETAANLAANPLPSKLDLFEKVIRHRKAQQGILKAFNVNSIVQHDAGDQFVADLGQDFQPAWDQVKQGAASIFQQGDVAGTSDLVAGLGKLVFNAGEATLNNKEGALGFVANNIPQLALGAFGKLGVAGMTASNVGYAADNYQQGMQDYQDKHGGDLPPPDVRNKMALQAASLALAEHVGDVATLKIAGQGAKDAARTSFKKSLTNVTKAAGEGVLSEAPTEGYQTYMEGEVTGKPVEAKDIYTGAVIGGVVGAGMAGGGRVLAEGAQATPEHAEKRAQDRQVIEKLDKAIETGDVSAYLDPSKPTYNPAKAAAVLFGNSQRDTTTPEAKTANLAKAHEILSGLEEQRDAASKELARTTPEGIQQDIDKYQAQADLFAESNPAQSAKFKQFVAMLQDEQTAIAANPVSADDTKTLTNQLNSLDRYIKSVREVTDQISTLVKPVGEDVTAAVELADTPASEASQNAAQRVITLSMTHPDAVTSEMADRLVSNAGNALTDQQRDYLRTTSEARIAANALKGMDTVHSEVLIGDAAKGQLGITDYQAKIGKAILGGNQKQADRYQEMLDTFAEHHAQKAQLFDQAFKKAQSTGEVTQLVPTKNGGWQVAAQSFSTIADLRAAGGVLIHKNSNSTKNGKTGLLSGIQAESRALISANKQLKAAYALKFTPVTTVNSVNEVANTTDAESTVDQGQLQSNPEGTVDPKVPSTTDKELDVQPNAAVVESNDVVPAEKPAQAASQDQLGTDEELSSAQKGELTVFQKAAEFAGKELGKVVDAAKGTQLYQKLNLIKEFLVQSAGKGEDKRPLVAQANFLTAWAAGDIKLEDFLGGRELSVEQQGLLEDFKSKAIQWLPMIQASLVKGAFNKTEGVVKDSPEFYFNDPIQFLVELVDGKADVDENVKVAIAQAAYGWVAENAGNPSLNTREQVKAMFGVADHEEISMELFRAIQDKGNMEKVVINAMGQRVTQALGLKENDKATQDFLPRLQSSLGAHVMKLLLDQGILERNEVPAQTIKEGLPGKQSSKTVNVDQGFLRLARNSGETLKERTLKDVALGIQTASKGTQGILTKLFGVVPDLIEPSWAPIKSKQATTKNTDQKVPAKLKKIIDHENAVGSRIRQDMWFLMNAISKDAFLTIAGAQDLDPDTMHKLNMESTEAGNDSLDREYERAMEYFQMVEDKSPEGLGQLLYFEHIVWKQQRVGIATNMVNPQTSKLQRWMLARPEWETEVSSTDAAMMDNFRLRVMEGLGTKTDKQDNVKSLAEFTTLFDPASVDPKAVTLRTAIAAIRTGVIEGHMTPELQQAIVAGVKAGGEKMHSLDALMAMAAHDAAKTDTGEFKFTVHMMGEVDGVTNGPMLSHLLLGAASNPDALYELLNKGGFFRAQNGVENYNVYRGIPGHKDLYETTIGSVIKNVVAEATSNAKINALLPAMWAITGTLVDSTGNVQKAGRNIIKTPLTAMIFGSAVEGAIRSMFEDFVLKTYDGFEALAGLDTVEQEAKRVEYIAHINTLLAYGHAKEMMPNVGISELLAFEFSKEQTTALEQAFNATLGDAVTKTMEMDFSVFMGARQVINNTAQANFALFDAVAQGVREKYVAELMDAGELPFAQGKTGRTPRTDLTVTQGAELTARLKDLQPIVHTLMSKESAADLSAGLHISKSSRKISTDPAYRGQVKFGKPMPDGKVNFTTAAYQRFLAAPGVAMVPMMMHSLDSAISHTAADGTQVLNIHDAHGTGLKHFTRTAQRLNAATWNAVLNYSPASEIRDSWLRTLTGIDAMLQSGEDTGTAVQGLKQAMQALAVKHKGKIETILQTLTDNMYLTAYSADQVKYETLNQMTSVDQYALEGGNYVVTEADREEAADRLKNLVGMAPADVLKMLERITSAVLDAKPAQVVQEMQPLETESLNSSNQWGALGKSVIASNPEIEKRFKTKPVMSGTEALRIAYANLDTNLSPRMVEFYKTLLVQVSKVMPADLTVRYVTPDTLPGDVAEHVSGARGWYVDTAKGNIYALSSDFKHSGLTAEVLIHEIVHGVLTKTVEKASSPEVRALIQDLENLRVKAQEFVSQMPTEQQDQYAAALSNVHELIAWGMSNQSFQKNVLNKISMESKTLGSQLISGMQHFINTVVGILFKGSTKSKQQIAQNGMTVLLSNVSGLFNAVASKETASHKTFAMASSPLHDYSNTDIYDAISTGAVSPAFDAHLRGLLTSIRLKAHGAYGSFMAARMQQTAHDPLSIWSEALRDGAAPLAKELRVPGIQLNDQVAFVADQVYAVMTTALTDNEGYSTVAARELAKLYSEVSAKVQPSDFYEGDWSKAKPQDRQQAEATHAAIFKMEKVIGDRTDHLARFAALGLAHPKFNALLNMATKQESHSLKNKTFSQRIESIFALVLDWINGLLTHTYAGQAANIKLTALVDQLIQIEDRKKARLAKQANATDYFGKAEDHTKAMLATVLKKIATVAGSTKVQNSSNALVAAGGSVVRMLANNQVDAFLNVLADYRNKNWKQNLGITAGLLNNVVGPNQVIETMLRGSKHIESQRHNIITMTRSLVKEMYADEGKNLSDIANAAVSSVLLRTGAHVLLDHFDMTQLHDLVANKDSRLKAIKQFEDQLTPFEAFKKDFLYQAKALAYHLVTGESKVEFGVLNAKNIASLTATSHPVQITEAESVAAEPIIDVLVSLYALNYSEAAELNAVAKLMATENARTDGNGVAFSLSLHQRLEQEAKDKLFVDADALMIKGYTPDIYNPYTNIKVANLAEGQDLISLGYTKESLLWKDPKDPDQEDRHICVLRDGGLLPYQTGIMSQTGMAHKGSLKENSNVDLWTAAGQRNLATQQRLNNTKRAAMRKAIDSNVDFDPSKEQQNFMVPLMNGRGEVVNWRYMMINRTKDALLERDSRSEQLLGVLAGSVYDKQQTDSQNRKAVEALHEEFKANYAKKADSFVSIGEKSSDPVNLEIYRLLPDVTKQAIKEIWGQDGMMVPVNMVDIMFGYRKLTISSAFDKVAANRKAKKTNPSLDDFAGVNIMEHALVFGVEWALKTYARTQLGMDDAAATQYANRGSVVMRRAERGWQEAVRLTKDLIVVRTGTVMACNILSNISLLKLHGVPWLDILHHHRVAMRAATSYQDDHEELFRLKTRAATGHTQNNAGKITRRITELEDSIARNPVKKLIDQGLMPTIVEDVETATDPYSYKTALTHKMEKYTSKINPTILSIAKTAVVAQDTQLYKTFSQITQLSDFVARYTLYQHLVNRKINPMTEEDALHEASESFINYDIPMHRMMQYTDDTGLTMFTKYFLGIQRVLARTTKEHPLRTLMTLAVDNFFNSTNLVVDSSALFHLGHDPIRYGAVQLPGAIWNISTIQGAMSLIK